MRECRAIILDRDNDWKVISYPYNKFFNYGEKWADPIGKSTAIFKHTSKQLMVVRLKQIGLARLYTKSSMAA